MASVHILVTKGGYHSNHLPVFGDGIVDFPPVFEIRGGEGFEGPYTMELEGPAVQGLTPTERIGFLRECVEYLDRVGVK